MSKVRLMGTKNDIKWFGKILQRNPKIEVTEFSDVYPNKGTKRFHRAYVEVKKRNIITIITIYFDKNVRFRTIVRES